MIKAAFYIGLKKVIRPTILSISYINKRTTFPCIQYAKKYSSTPPQRPPSFFGKLYDNLKDEMARNQKLKESLRDFRKDMEDLDKSEALQKAREKYKIVEEETAEGTKKAKMQLESLKQKVKETVEEAQKTELLQKASRVTEEASKTAQRVGQTISQKGEEIAKSQTYKTLSDTARIVKEEIDTSTFGKRGRVYRPPKVLKMRVDRNPEHERKIIEANAEATGITVHKDSKFSQSWQEFKDKNPYINKVLEWRTKLDESENPIVRASVLIKEKATELFGGVFQRTELSETLTEICKMDPTFDKEMFLLECEFVIIPNILEAIIRPDLKVLEDWCHEKTFRMVSAPIQQALHLGFHFDSKVLDVDNVDLVMGKMMEEGPVLALTFQSQQILSVRNSKGEVIEGDPSKVLRVQYVWILCRDQMDTSSHTAWRLLEYSANSSEQLV